MWRQTRWLGLNHEAHEGHEGRSHAVLRFVAFVRFVVEPVRISGRLYSCKR